MLGGDESQLHEFCLESERPGPGEVPKYSGNGATCKLEGRHADAGVDAGRIDETWHTTQSLVH